MTTNNWAGQFELYDKANPQIWEMFKKYARELLLAGRSHAGAKMIMERIRWETTVSAQGDGFKINNNYAAYYARKLMASDPVWKDFFNTREVPTVVRLTKAGIDALLNETEDAFKENI